MTEGVVGDERSELMTYSYSGEVLGEFLFSALTTENSNPKHRAILEAMRRVEEITRDRLKPMLVRHGISLGDQAAIREEAMKIAKELNVQPWREMWVDLLPAIEAALDKFIRLRELVADPKDGEVCDFLVKHEEALKEFVLATRDERDGAMSKVEAYLREASE